MTDLPGASFFIGRKWVWNVPLDWWTNWFRDLLHIPSLYMELSTLEESSMVEIIQWF